MPILLPAALKLQHSNAVVIVEILKVINEYYQNNVWFIYHSIDTKPTCVDGQAKLRKGGILKCVSSILYYKPVCNLNDQKVRSLAE